MGPSTHTAFSRRCLQKVGPAKCSIESPGAMGSSRRAIGSTPIDTPPKSLVPLTCIDCTRKTRKCRFNRRHFVVLYFVVKARNPLVNRYQVIIMNIVVQTCFVYFSLLSSIPLFVPPSPHFSPNLPCGLHSPKKGPSFSASSRSVTATFPPATSVCSPWRGAWTGHLRWT